MRKILLLLILFITSFTLLACTTSEDTLPVDCELEPTHLECDDIDPIDDDPIDDDPIDDDPIDDGFDPSDIGFLDIYYINDFHGSILEDGDKLGFANIANLLITQKELYPENTVILAGGDILQGSALSNYYYGLSTINMMSEMYFDALTFGNHEFDWGLETITNYFDDDLDNGEADFSLLGANIFYKNTTTIPDGIEPYIIIERGDLKIGIIGTIGYGLEGSIATSKIEDYEFGSPVAIIRDYAYLLRTTMDVDIIIVSSHDTGGGLNQQLAALTGEYKIDAIFNGHNHSAYAESNLGIPVLQSGSNGRNVGHVRLELTNNVLTGFTVENLDSSSSELLRSPNDLVEGIIAGYQLETDSLFNVPLITTGEYLSVFTLSNWIAKMMRISTGADIGFQNGGGTRRSVSDDTVMNLGLLYEIWPFDNVVKTVYLTGSQIKDLMGGLYYDTEISNFSNNTLYKVATNDYVFDNSTHLS